MQFLNERNTKDMGLITKEVEVKLGGKNIKYYENLGYQIPRYYNEDADRYMLPKGASIIVKVEDLSPNSHTKVDVECDECHDRKDVFYNLYCKRKNSNSDKYYCKRCASKLYISGENNPGWNPNLTDKDRQKRKHNNEYNIFIRKVLARDNYICQCCGRKNGEVSLIVHHLDGFDWCVEKRTDTSNGITLCETCHKSFHMKYGYGGNTKEQFEEWLGYAVELLKYDKELPTVQKFYCIEEDKIYDSANAVKEAFNLKYPAQVYYVANRNDTRNRTIKGKHFLYYDDYLTMAKEEIDYYVNVLKPGRIRKVRCITTGEIFNNIADAEKKYPQSQHIWDCCKGYSIYSGTLPDGTKLQWEYYNPNQQVISA